MEDRSSNRRIRMMCFTSFLTPKSTLHVCDDLLFLMLSFVWDKLFTCDLPTESSHGQVNNDVNTLAEMVYQLQLL